MSIKTMSKKKQGAIAAIAGGALLLGTGGTFAVWQDVQVLGGTGITTGALWFGTSDGPTAPDINWEVSAPHYLVPGTSAIGTLTIPTYLQGEDLTATLTGTFGTLSNSLGGVIELEWRESASDTWVSVASGVPFEIDTDVTTGESNFNEAQVRVSFPANELLSPEASRAQMGEAITLDGITLTLEQTPPTPATP